MKLTNKQPKKLVLLGEYRGLPVYVASRVFSYNRARFYCKKKARYYILDLKEILGVKIAW